MLGGIHTRMPHLAPYDEADGFHVLGPGAPLDLELPIGRLRYPAEPSMRHWCTRSPRRSRTGTVCSGAHSPAGDARTVRVHCGRAPS